MWRRASRITRSSRLDYLADVYDQRAPNFGVWTDAPKQVAIPLAQAAPLILAQDKRRDTELWTPLFALWPNWHWGIQPTGDCTRWMQQHLEDALLANLLAAGKIGRPDAQTAGEILYGFAKCELRNSYRYHGPGCSGRALADASVKYGKLYRLLYEQEGQSCDLREETELSKEWGDYGRGVPDWLEPLAAQHKAADRVSIGSATEMGLLIQARYACQYCGYTDWGLTRGEDGIARRFKSGWHALTATGVRWDANGEPLAFWIANTGHGDHCEGPVGPIPIPDIYAQCGSWVPAERIQRVIEAGDCYSTSFVEGWPVLTIPDFGTKEFL